jgi:UDP-N-acetylglucosamine 2-epimerase (non-hydrolysing)
MSVVGTRPNFMKVAPVARELGARPEEFAHVLVHTGQHYDDSMSQVFIDQLGMGEPDHFLEVGSGSHGQQLARVVERLEPLILEVEPALVLVAGDVNSTLAAALAAKAAGAPLGHIEAGLRSFDRTLPEESNRVVVDALSQLLFVHSPEARDNLLAEGREATAIFDVGNTMIDTLVALRDRIEAADTPRGLGLRSKSYLVVTLHRHWLFEEDALLAAAMTNLQRVSRELDVVFPMHPRTQAAAERLGIGLEDERLRLLPALGYLEFLSLVAGAAAVLTDSGGVQEETTFLGIPCFTLRPNTERPITVECGTNTILGLDPERIADIPALLRGARPSARVPARWDGRAAQRIVDVLASEFAAGRA